MEILMGVYAAQSATRTGWSCKQRRFVDGRQPERDQGRGEGLERLLAGARSGASERLTGR